ncbi:N-acetylmuramoyl-L-alanine amidase family protein [Anaerosinus gibii]|uniref:N-acetylmuramoyl-L-alanine amidase n=1 Tax=Selenobaculum gibii TaxID=3054208 RepID=A0A9Y2AI87_9FIRM|nr:N-acetylmuramoyl-L-alanine amidase [Selenobaculum gbiensis]WIW70448.1 N-acetylmuramoyl-L-alanine amidase [Selenobaculum gbiensis]
MKIFLNPGHQPGVDSGAVNKELGLQECYTTLNISKRVKQYLEAVGYQVQMVQSDNLAGESPQYINVTESANTWGADLFISIHCNSAPRSDVRGVETLCCGLGDEGERLAECIQDQVVATIQKIDFNFPDRGVKKDVRGLAVLRATAMPAVLVEMAFINNVEDAKLLIDYEDEFARAIARGISDFYA